MKDLLTRKEIIGIIKEAYGDDYKMSAARAKTITKIEKQLKGNKGASGSGKGFTNKPDVDDYQDILDSFFANEEKLKKHVVETPKNFNISVDEYYYDDTNNILAVVRTLKNKQGDTIEVSSPIIAPSLYDQIRKAVGLQSKDDKFKELLKKYFNTKSIVKFQPVEKLSDLLGPEKEIVKKVKEPEKVVECVREDIVQEIDKFMANLNLKKFNSDIDTIKYIGGGKRETYYTFYTTQDGELVYFIENIKKGNWKEENEKKLKMKITVAEEINQYLNNNNINLEKDCLGKNIQKWAKVDDYNINNFYMTDKEKMTFEKFNNKGDNLQEELNKIKHMFQIL